MELTLPRLVIFAVAWWLTAPIAAQLYFEWFALLPAVGDCPREEQDARIHGMAGIIRAFGALASIAGLISLL